MHAGAFVQVTAARCLACGTALCWCAALGDPLHRCSALRLCSRSVAAWRSRFLGEPLGDVRFAPLSNFR